MNAPKKITKIEHSISNFELKLAQLDDEMMTYGIVSAPRSLSLDVTHLQINMNILIMILFLRRLKPRKIDECAKRKGFDC